MWAEPNGQLAGVLLKVVEDTPTVYNLLVCTLCSCYPISILGALSLSSPPLSSFPLCSLPNRSAVWSCNPCLVQSECQNLLSMPWCVCAWLQIERTTKIEVAAAGMAPSWYKVRPLTTDRNLPSSLCQDAPCQDE